MEPRRSGRTGGISASIGASSRELLLLTPWFVNFGVSLVWDVMAVSTVRTSSDCDAIAAYDRYAAAAVTAVERSSKKEGSVSTEIWLSTMDEKEALYIW